MKERILYDSFRKLFEKHYAELCSLAYNYLKDTERSKDIVQEVFIKVWEKKKDLVQESNAHYYLFTAVKNNCIDVLRKHKYTLSLSDDAVANKVADEETDTIEKKQNEPTTQEFIQKALDELPPKCRVIFMMSRLDAMTYQQIADKLEISVKTVENQMGKAIRIMREYIKRHDIPTILILIVKSMLKENRGFLI
ncbi:RNA polymerase sigma-70 factor (ECF subfamily) [Aquimarina sp. MAR_2010_214]|uniref:RNA polymerase sigma-70 factor n=1 Tax=Aquimarina sp. MAR_2010_214 TaxID=1250026 RepID=UPI000C7093BF|nr:RNA polymerase sigma-70 factor [Aquimarina sp. MAR_2010_214]PKV50265.1 RNA polymerase sigma-70 factor (ECF subfamily) [Aquimarina sp. MAR_2010_214]